ncbi:MAG: ROK family protein [Jatrophihabitantaceae bacterium]
MPSCAVLDVGGTHVTGALVDTAACRVLGAPVRVELDAQAGVSDVLARLAEAGAAIAGGAAIDNWAVAMPDPFDYDAGIGRFHGVAKFESLDGVDVRDELARRLPGGTLGMVFCNDADAFTVGEWLAGAARGSTRPVGVTLGTGVGTGWTDGGRIVDPGVPPGGRAHLLHVDGAPLEESMSRRAIRRAYAEATGDRDADVREIAALARAGDLPARAVLARALRSLGRALAVPLRDFAADMVVVGGSMSASWELFEAWFREGAGDISLPPVRIASDAVTAPLLGAAYVAATRSR